MLSSFALAVRDTLAPAQRRPLLLSVAGAAAILLALIGGVAWGLGRIDLEGHASLQVALQILGELAALALAWLIFPAVATTLLSFFLDGVLDRLDRQHYPGLPPARPVPLRTLLGSGLRLLLLSLLLNLTALPVYLLFPGINLFLFYILNGYLLSREYFDLVALRRFGRAGARALWTAHRGRWFLAGVAIAVPLSLPLVNLAAPLLAAAFMLHLVAREGELPALGSRQ